MIFPGFPVVLSFFQVFQVFQVEWEPCWLHAHRSYSSRTEEFFHPTTASFWRQNWVLFTARKRSGGEGSASGGFCIQGLCIQGGLGRNPPPHNPDTMGYSQRVGGTHPTGMHSCFRIFLVGAKETISDAKHWLLSQKHGQNGEGRFEFFWTLDLFTSNTSDLIC